MRAEVIAIGTELTSGQSLDTNSRWISAELAGLGLTTAFHTTLGDVLDDHVAAFQTAAARAGFVITSGGLGPTQDDLVREALALAAAVPLIESAECLEAIQALFVRRSRPMPERNRVQALIPEGAEPLPNRTGTAPGIWMKLGSSTIACLPGVPSEMKIMFHEQVVPRLRALGLASGTTFIRKINLFGKGESEIEAQALDLTARGREPEVGITASEATISFRIAARGETPAEAEKAAGETARIILDRFGDLVIGEGDVDVPQSVLVALQSRNKTIATAESCTGGLMSAMLTSIPGSSRSFLGGVVSYSNEAKTAFLGVPRDLIAQHGAVSPEVAAAMAQGAREHFGVDIAVSTTGIAGPDGGSETKPVGLVYLGLADASGVKTRKLELGPDSPRDVIQRRAAKQALNWARLIVSGEPG